MLPQSSQGMTVVSHEAAKFSALEWHLLALLCSATNVSQPLCAVVLVFRGTIRGGEGDAFRMHISVQ